MMQLLLNPHISQELQDSTTLRRSVISPRTEYSATLQRNFKTGRELINLAFVLDIPACILKDEASCLQNEGFATINWHETCDIRIPAGSSWLRPVNLLFICLTLPALSSQMCMNSGDVLRMVHLPVMNGDYHLTLCSTDLSVVTSLTNGTQLQLCM